MKRPEGGFEVAYNAQAAVDDLRQIIVAADVGKKIYAKRKHIIEPVFGVIKHIMKFGQFLLRGLEKAKGGVGARLPCLQY